MKERMRTVSVALVLCLNVGVDPPDIVKTQPCARLECWMDPLQIPPQRALETIVNALQKQYERWQPRARYKNNLDPTVDDVKKLCTTLRKNAKDDRVLFHYNGHGVPKPTANGEIWVFNRNYTQYIPLSIYDLQQWMGAPSVFIYDCSCAGLIIDSFNQFAAQHEREHEQTVKNGSASTLPPYRNCIQLAACGPTQILPMNPDLPADLFTACLTTPIKAALRWFVLQRNNTLVPHVNVDQIDKIPGQLSDRRTMLGELNWLFTAITDTIAWNVLPRELFQRLFRQDLLVASLFRNYLLAERVLRSYNCHPVSSPKLPQTYHHPMWEAWDLALEQCLAQLPAILHHGATFQHSSFFAEQLTAFQVWLNYCRPHYIPEQLPIVLQVLLSQAHRVKALELLSRFLDLGPWAVNLALSVGIFPYVLKLLQSSARELKPLLAFVWAKVIAVDKTCQADLVRDNGHKYFLTIIGDSTYSTPEHRTLAAFVLASVVHNHHSGQLAVYHNNAIPVCLEPLETETHPPLRQWLALALGNMWANFDKARWCGVRNSAHEKLYTLLTDSCPQVRAAAVYALGTYFGSAQDLSEHAISIDHSVGIKLVNTVLTDGSPVVRKELVVALHWLVLAFENQFVAVAFHYMEEEKQKSLDSGSSSARSGPESIPSSGSLRKVASRDKLRGSPYSGGHLEVGANPSMRRVSSSTALHTLGGGGAITSGVYGAVWRALMALATDPMPSVASLAQTVVAAIHRKVQGLGGGGQQESPGLKSSSSFSEPSSPSGKQGYISMNPIRGSSGEGDAADKSPKVQDSRQLLQQYQYSAQFTHTRKIFDKAGPSLVQPPTILPQEEPPGPRTPLVETDFFPTSLQYFTRPVIKTLLLNQPEETDPDSTLQQEREWRYIRNHRIRKSFDTFKKKIVRGRLDEQLFINRNQRIPETISFHPYEPHLVVTDSQSFTVYDWETGSLLVQQSNLNAAVTRITSQHYLNPHDSTLLLLGSDDGSVKVWKHYDSSPELLTAYQLLTEMLVSQRGSGMVTHWEQDSRLLLGSGDVRVIKIWDAQSEMKSMELPTGADCSVTSLTSDSVSYVVVAGCADGSIRLFDRRLPPNDARIMTLREHSSRVVNVSLQRQSSGVNLVVSGSVDEGVKFWDLRHCSAYKKISGCSSMKAMALHPNYDILACGSVNHFISVHSLLGTESPSYIRFHDGFMGNRIGPITCLAFHPYKIHLASGSTDNIVAVYTMERKYS
ncbi:RPTOR [Cordylochernes scorpioides]|uniref:RPTOR n=1 Tax=Cordylochernes scorpioides TaxID=51811 RepID=A0ABY6LMW7_9ARAC|nr:RPTOR [Cordylochernes scorpioides]